MTYRCVALVLLLTALGCGSERSDDVSSSYSISDSSGVTIVSNFSESWTDETKWEVGDSPILEIGTVDGETAYLFKRIGGVFRLPDGSIVVADETEIRLFDQNGVHIRTEGRKGEGPGEYEYIREIMRCQPNHFNVYDLSWRQSTYTYDGDFVETRQVLPNGIRPYTLRCTPSAVFVSLLWASQTYELPIGLYETESVMLVGDAEVGVDTVMTVSGGQRIGSERGSRPHPFGTTTSFSVLEESIVISTGENYEYHIYDLQGELRKIVRMPGQDRTIRSEDIDAQARKEAQGYPAETFDSYVEEFRNIEMPDHFPAYSQLRIDSNNNIWLRRHTRPLDPFQRWDITDSKGVFLGSIEFDADVEIKQIGNDFIIGHRTTKEGVPQVAMWRLSRGAGLSSD